MSAAVVSIRDVARVVSIRDIDYELPVDSAYLPACLRAGAARIAAANPAHEHALKEVFELPAVNSVWGIVLEQNKNPVLVLQNLARSRTTLTFRRVLLVRLDSMVHDSQTVVQQEQEEDCDPMPLE